MAQKKRERTSADTHQLLDQAVFSQLADRRHQINEGRRALVEGVGEVGPELVAERQQMMRDVQAVVVMQGSQLRQLVLGNTTETRSKTVLNRPVEKGAPDENNSKRKKCHESA